MEEVVVLVAGFLSINFLSYILYLIITNKFKESTREFYRDTILSISEEAREWVKESDKVYPLFNGIKGSDSPLDRLLYDSLISTATNSLVQIITAFRTLSTPKTTTEPSSTKPSCSKTGPSCSKTTTNQSSGLTVLTGSTGPTGPTGPC